MGQNHARVIRSSTEVQSLLMYDMDQAALHRACEVFNGKSARSIEDFQDCDGVVIAAATASHKELANQLLEMNIPLLIEKPICEDYLDTEAIVNKSQQLEVPLMCGFVERFNPAISTALKILNGPVRHLYSYRHSPMNNRATSDVVTDLLIHDLDLTARIAPSEIVPTISSTHWTPSGRRYSEAADSIFRFGEEMTAVQSASRWSQRKIREIRIATDELLIEIDLLRVNLTVYRHRTQSGGVIDPASYQSETLIEIPFIRHTGEPLASQFKHFIGLISGSNSMEDELNSLLKPHQWAAQICKS
jgi:predicted dehydrogenase